jgi:3-oxosteroid 1-dehydrogenase
VKVAPTTDLSVDVAIVGSGAAGLVAACRAADGGRSVAVLEKADLLGGTSAVSGGVMWMPNHHLMGEAYPDSDEGALAYLNAATGGRVPDERLRWYLTTSREAVRWLDDETLVRLATLPRPDYHTEWPGAARGRGLDLLPFDGAKYPG